MKVVLKGCCGCGLCFTGDGDYRNFPAVAGTQILLIYKMGLGYRVKTCTD